MPESSARGEPVGRYVLHAQIASGGMATVHIGRLVGEAGFARTVAIKRMRPHLSSDPQFVSSFVDEARLTACVRHPNVVPTLDVVVRDGEILVVMEYVEGESLSRLLKKGPAPLPIVATIASHVLSGLHAAHEAVNPKGEPLRLVHRDVSPQNVMVGTDGIARVLDFGVAKASWRLQNTRDGVLKGKLGYMSPEQLKWRPFDRRADIYAASVVLWEALTGRRLFGGDASDEEIVRKILVDPVPPPSTVAPALPAALDGVLLRGLSRRSEDRFDTALQMAVALEAVAPLATAREVGAWVAERAHDALFERAELLRELERSTLENDSRFDSAVTGREAGPNADTSALVIHLPRTHGAEATRHALSSPAIAVTGGHRGRWGLAGLVLVAVVAGGAGAALRAWATRVDGSKPRLQAPEAAGGEAVAPGGAGISDANPADANPATAASVSMDFAVMPTAPSAHAPIRHARPATSKSESSHVAKPLGCDPPYTIGPDGIHRFRPECLE